VKPIQLSAVLLAASLLPSSLHATQPTGILALVERVVLEPAGDKPSRIQVWGAFSIASEEYGKFQAPARGYLYFEAPAGKEDAARKEWADLKRLAQSGKCAAFGNRFEQNVKLRKLDARAEKPDAYPMSIGVREMSAKSDYPPVVALARLRGPLSPQAGDKVPPGPVTVRYDEAFVLDHPAAKVVFEIEAGAEKETSEPIAPKDRVATWQPRLEMRAGVKYTVRVRAVDGEWKGEAVSSTFEAKGS
jgi:hypothetical protein